MREFRPYGSVRGALSNGRPYRDLFKEDRGCATDLARTFLIDTTSDVISGTGDINLRTENVDYQIRTAAKHFTIGALPGPITISGSFKKPRGVPDIGKLILRGGAALGQRTK